MNILNLEQLANIVEISKTKSLTLAANNRNITLPTLSQSLSQFEKEINIKLFKRSRSGTIPTKEGQLIINKAREIILKIEILNETIQIIKNELNGTIRFGSLPGFMPLIIDSFSDFKKTYPLIKSNLFEGSTTQIYEKLLNQDIDIALLAFDDKDQLEKKEYYFEKVTSCKTVIAVNNTSPLAKKISVTLSDISDYPIAIHDDYKIMDILSSDNNFDKIDIALRTNNLDSIRKSLSNNTAITIGLNYSFITDPYFIQQEDIVLIDLIVPFPQNQFIGFVRLNNTNYSEITRVMVEFAKKQFNKYIDI